MNSIKIYKDTNLCVCINTLTIDKYTSLSNLENYFLIKTTKAKVGCKENVLINFVSYTIHENGLTINVNIKFEEKKIIALYISILEFDNNFNRDIGWDFYHQIPKRETEYKKWLEKHTNYKIENFNTPFTQHSIEVGRNKSDDTFICISWRE